MSNTKAIEILEKMIWSVKSPSWWYDDPYDEWYEKWIVDWKMYALEDAKERIEALPDEWISVEDRLPESTRFYLWLVHIGDMDRVDKVFYEQWEWRESGTNYEFTENVTHWMPLPNIPKQ